MDSILSAREMEILHLVAQGLSNREIAKSLDLAPKTIEHLLGTSDPHRGIYSKINVTNRTEAAAWYVTTFSTRINTDQDTTHKLTVDKLHKELVEVYLDYQSRITQLRNDGQPQLAISMADYLVTKTEEAANQAPPDRYRQMYLRITRDALVDKCTAYLETVPRTKMEQYIKPLTKSIKGISREINDRNSAAIANVLLAGSLNIQKRYEAGRKLYQEAYEQTTDVDVKLRALRGVTIASTYLHDQETADRIMPLAKNLITGGHFTKLEQVYETSEGLGRAHGLWGSSEGFIWLDKAEQILHLLNHPPFRTLQFLMSKQVVLMRMERNAASEIERVGKQAIELAERYGYHRHKEVVLENLSKALDS